MRIRPTALALCVIALSTGVGHVLSERASIPASRRQLTNICGNVNYMNHFTGNEGSAYSSADYECLAPDYRYHIVDRDNTREQDAYEWWFSLVVPEGATHVTLTTCHPETSVGTFIRLFSKCPTEWLTAQDVEFENKVNANDNAECSSRLGDSEHPTELSYMTIPIDQLTLQQDTENKYIIGDVENYYSIPGVFRFSWKFTTSATVSPNFAINTTPQVPFPVECGAQYDTGANRGCTLTDYTTTVRGSSGLVYGSAKGDCYSDNAYITSTQISESMQTSTDLKGVWYKIEVPNMASAAKFQTVANTGQTAPRFLVFASCPNDHLKSITTVTTYNKMSSLEITDLQHVAYLHEAGQRYWYIVVDTETGNMSDDEIFGLRYSFKIDGKYDLDSTGEYPGAMTCRLPKKQEDDIIDQPAVTPKNDTKKATDQFKFSFHADVRVTTQKSNVTIDQDTLIQAVAKTADELETLDSSSFSIMTQLPAIDLGANSTGYNGLKWQFVASVNPSNASDSVDFNKATQNGCKNYGNNCTDSCNQVDAKGTIEVQAALVDVNGNKQGLSVSQADIDAFTTEYLNLLWAGNDDNKEYLLDSVQSSASLNNNEVCVSVISASDSVTKPQSPPPGNSNGDSSGVNLAPILGGIAGGLVAVAAVLAAFAYRRRQLNQPSSTTEATQSAAAPAPEENAAAPTENTAAAPAGETTPYGHQDSDDEAAV